MGKTHRKIMAERANNLRCNMTWAEKRLWFGFLREYDPPFRPQKVIGNYILDFYCSKVRLCIELDGDSHYGYRAGRYDDIRTIYLNMEEIEVIRFSNNDIRESFEGVCIAIDEVVKSRRNDLHTSAFKDLLKKR